VYRLSNITLIFLPANTTSIVQPLDQASLLPSKPTRAQLVQFVRLDRNPDMTMQQVKINAYQAVVGAAASKALTTATIRNCWWKAGILGGQSTSATVPRSDVATHVQVTCSCQRCRGP
jgi:hypothetical protein